MTDAEDINFGAIRRPHECFDGYHRPHGHLGGNCQPWQLDMRLMSEINSEVFSTLDTLSIIYTSFMASSSHSC
jgi:hypothetical protein